MQKMIDSAAYPCYIVRGGILHTFERKLQEKITSDCLQFAGLLQRQAGHGDIPRFQFSSIWNAPNKLAGQRTTFTIHLHADRCVKCGRCIQNCPHHALEKDTAGCPVFLKKSCENCYRCVLHCPQLALSLSKRRKIEKTLKYD